MHNVKKNIHLVFELPEWRAYLTCQEPTKYAINACCNQEWGMANALG